LAYRKPWKSREVWAWSEEDLKKEETAKENCPIPQITEKLSERQFRKDKKTDKKTRVEDEPCNFRLEKG